MFERIVVPLDGSWEAEAALAPARSLAREFSARLVLVRAVAPYGLPQILDSTSAAAIRRPADTAEIYLQGTAERLRAEGLETEFVLALSEPPGASIAHVAELDAADLIVMTTHVRWRTLSMEPSVTLAALGRTHTPLLAWRAPLGDRPAAEEAPAGEAAPPIASAEAPILVPLDGSALAEAALPVASALARATGAYLALLRVTPQGDTAMEDTARDYLREIEARLAEDGVAATSRVKRGAVVSAIDTLWRETNAGIIVLASRGQTGRPAGFLGSVAARLLTELDAPTLVTQPSIPARNGRALGAIASVDLRD